MDASLLASAGIGTTTMAILFIAYRVLQSAKGRRFVSNCCGRKGEVGFDVRDMPPTPPEGTHSPPTASAPPSDAKPQSPSVAFPIQTEPLAEKGTA